MTGWAKGAKRQNKRMNGVYIYRKKKARDCINDVMLSEKPKKRTEK